MPFCPKFLCFEETMESGKSAMKRNKRQFNGSSTCEQVLKGSDLSGKTIAVTGTTNGIGMEAARHLALSGAHVICLNRNKDLTEQTIEKVLKEKGTVLMSFIECDLSSVASVRSAAEQIIRTHERLDVLVLNAGVFLPPQKATADGLDMTCGVNHVGHFHLTTLLLPLLEKSAPSRIVIVASEAHASTGLSISASLDDKVTKLLPAAEDGVGVTRGLTLYGLSKLCNVLFAFKLHRDLARKGVDVYVLHPGSLIGTNIGSSLGIWGQVLKVLAWPFNKSLSQGASTTVYCAVHPETKGVSGKYWESCWDDEKRLSKEFAHDEQLQEELWKRTVKIIEGIEQKK